MKHEFNMGRTVLCDLCGANWTDRPESGGLLFGTKAVCPDCTKRILRNIERYHEEQFIRAKCPNRISFADWVRNLRGGNNTVTIYDMTG